jgi:aldehyde dehydrogenase (NAD+)
MMTHNLQFYIDGAWVDPVAPNVLDVIDPSNEDAFAQISLGSKADVDKAVAAAKRAFQMFGFSDPEERLDILHRIIEVYKKRSSDLALAVSREMGAPRQFALDSQVGIGLAHLTQMAETLKNFQFRQVKGNNLVVKEPIGVVRPHHAVELADQPDHLQSRPGDRCGLHHGAEAERDRAAQRHSSSPKIMRTRPACPRASSTSSTATGSEVGQAIATHPDIDMRVVHRLDARWASWSPRRQRTRSSACTRNSAASRRTSSLGMPISKSRCARASHSCFVQQRPVVQGADPHVRAAATAS